MTCKATGRAWDVSVTRNNWWWNDTERWFHDHRGIGYSYVDQPLVYRSIFDALNGNRYGWYDYSADFFQYEASLDAQINQFYCAVASSCALLNSFRPLIELPIDPICDPYPYATQIALLRNQKCVNKHVIHYNNTFNGIMQFPGGLSLAQVKELLRCHLPDINSWDVSMHHVDPSIDTVETVRRALELALRDPSARVLINYDRKGLGQEGAGHFSPLGSYSPRQDAFLVMDVA